MDAHPARALPGAGADLEHVAAGDLAEHPGLVLGRAPRGPRRSRCRRGSRRGSPGTRRRTGPSRGRWPAATPPRSTARRSTRTRCGRWSSTARPYWRGVLARWQRGARGLLRPDAAGGRLVRADLPRRGRRASARWCGSTRPGRRDDAAPEIDAAVLRLVRGLVPVARRPRGTPRRRRRGPARAARHVLPPGGARRPAAADARRRRRGQCSAAASGPPAPTSRACRPCGRAVRRRRPARSATSACADGAARLRRRPRGRPRWDRDLLAGACAAWPSERRPCSTPSAAPASCTPTSTPRTSWSTRPR